MIKIRTFFLYYQRFGFTALLFIVVMGMAGGQATWHLTPFLFMMTSHVFQLVTYHALYKKERIFFFHLGFSDYSLWTYSFLTNLLISLILRWI